MNHVLILIVLVLGVARATRLVVADTFPPIMAARTWIYRLGHRVVAVEFTPTTQLGSTFKALAESVTGQPPTRTQVSVVPRWAWLGELVTCAWCASGWLSLGAVAWTARVTSLPLPVAWWGAVWMLAAVITVGVGVLFDADGVEDVGADVTA